MHRIRRNFLRPCSRLLWTSPSLDTVLGRSAGSSSGSSGGSSGGGGGAAAAAVLAGMQELAALDGSEGAHQSPSVHTCPDGVFCT